MSDQLRLRLAAALLLLAAVPAPGQTPDPDRPSQGLLQDAASYAEGYGVSLDEAVRRLELQHEIGDLDATLGKQERDTYAGLWIEHEPEYRVIVRLVEPFAVDRLKALVAKGPLATLVETRPARWTLADLEGKQTAARHLAAGLGVDVNSDIDVLENRVQVYVVEEPALRSGLASAGLQMPEGVAIVPVDRLAELELQTLTGGVALSDCTGGFTVRAGSGELGISTAAHCDNPQTYLGTVLPFRAERNSGDQDVQWNSACDLFDVTNQFNSGIGLRSCIGTRHRNNQAIGSYVCKWGKTTGRTCGTIQSKNFDPGPNHNATFIRVDGGSTNLSEPGDSGAPWFVEDLAYGIHRGAPGDDANDSYYMAINYISAIGVSVLTYNPGPGCNLTPTASFTWSIPYPLVVDFDASASSDPDGSIVSYSWDFGDGTSGTTTSPTISHGYDSEQTYYVTLTVTDNEGATGTTGQGVSLCPPYIFCGL